MENKHWICLCISYTIELYFYYQFNSIEKGSLYPMALFQIQNLRSNEVHRKVSVNVLLPVDSHAQHPAGAVSYTHLDVYKRQGEYDRKIETQRN